MAERWVVCTRSPLYEVSDQGRVRRKDTGRLLKPTQNHKQGKVGYLKVCLGRRCQAYVHQLVAEAFLGPRPPEHDVDHIDWDRMNNAVANLRWLPQTENRFRWSYTGWVLKKHEEREPPEGHEPMTEEEEHELEAALAVWAEDVAPAWGR